MGRLIDFTGKKVGALTIIKRGENDQKGKPKWICRCDCGNDALVGSWFLSSQQVTSCGCGIHKNLKRTVEMAGQKFGRLTVIDRSHKSSSQGMFWRCLCDCGTEISVRGAKLRNGHTASCGCLRIENMTTHGHTGHGKNRKFSFTYYSWKNMIARCTQPANPAYDHYKKRGIDMCEEWLKFENFLADMGERPGGKNEYTLERIDNDKGYYPGNCKWATKREQGNNRISNIHFTYKDKRYTLAELARETGVAKETLRCRLVRPGGWDVDAAVETPVMSRQERGHRGGSAGLGRPRNYSFARRIEYKGEVYSLAALARLAGCLEETLRYRLKNGWSVAEAVETPAGSARKIAS